MSPDRSVRVARAARQAQDRGSATVEFVMVSVLLIMLLFAVFQVAVYFYARNVAAASVAAAARFTAAEGVDPGAGSQRAATLIHQGLDEADASAIVCHSSGDTDPVSGLRVVTVHCSGRLRLLFSALATPLRIDVSSSVLREGLTCCGRG